MINLRALIHTINGSDILDQEEGSLAKKIGKKLLRELFPHRIYLCDIGRDVWKIREEDGSYRYEVLPETSNEHLRK